MTTPALLHAGYALAHARDFARYGSKPTREPTRAPTLLEAMNAALRPWEAALAYPPNQVFAGNMTPEALAERPRPWGAHPLADAHPIGPFGRIVNQAAFYGLMKLSDDYRLARAQRGTGSGCTRGCRGAGQRCWRASGQHRGRLRRTISAHRRERKWPAAFPRRSVGGIHAHRALAIPLPGRRGLVGEPGLQGNRRVGAFRGAVARAYPGRANRLSHQLRRTSTDWPRRKGRKKWSSCSVNQTQTALRYWQKRLPRAIRPGLAPWRESRWDSPYFTFSTRESRRR